jgi:uncharacterized protein YjdB
MKRSLAVVLSLVLVVILAGPVLANGNAYGSMKQSSNFQKKQNMQTVKFQNQNWGLQQRVNASLQQQFRTNMKANKGFNKSPFKDVGSHWASNYIGSMYNIGLFQGYPDGSFRPDQQLSQAEALSLIMRIAAEATTGDEDDYYTGYSNVPSWLQQDYYKAYQRNIIPTNGFNCYGQASRVQTAVMIAKALGLEPVDTSDIPFKDYILMTDEELGYVLALYQEGIISGTPNGYFNPNNYITRAEMAAILERLLDIIDGTAETDETDVESVSLPKTAKVEQGESITLKAVVTYEDGDTDNDVTWSSSDTSLAKVKKGVVTAADDETGTVKITATSTKDTSVSATCKVTVVENEDEDEEVIAGTLEATGRTGGHDGKVYEEYVFVVDDEDISLAEDDVDSITLQKDNGSIVSLDPNSDETLWFDVQRESGKYTITVTDDNDKTYAAVIYWDAPTKLTVTATGDEEERDGDTYTEYKLGNFNLTSFTCMYQITPDDDVIKLTDKSDKTLWINTDNQDSGKHVFLIKKNNTWYTATVRI